MAAFDRGADTFLDGNLFISDTPNISSKILEDFPAAFGFFGSNPRSANISSLSSNLISFLAGGVLFDGSADVKGFGGSIFEEGAVFLIIGEGERRAGGFVVVVTGIVDCCGSLLLAMPNRLSTLDLSGAFLARKLEKLSSLALSLSRSSRGSSKLKFIIVYGTDRNFMLSGIYKIKRFCVLVRFSCYSYNKVF